MNSPSVRAGVRALSGGASGSRFFVVKAAVVIADLQIWVGGVAEILESQDARHAIDARLTDEA